MNEDSSLTLNRRRFVQAIGGGTVAATATSGIAAAEPVDRTRIEARVEEYRSDDDVRSAVETHADGIVRTLEDRDLLPSESVGAMFDSGRLDLEDYIGAEEGWHVSGTKTEETYTAEIFLKYLQGAYTIEVFVQPEAAISYAHLQYEDEDEVELLGSPRADMPSATTADDEVTILAQPCGCCCRESDAGCSTTYPTGRQIRRKFCTGSSSYCGHYIDRCCSTLLGC